MRLSKFNIMARDTPEKGSCAVYNTLTRGMVVLKDHILKGLEEGLSAGLSSEEVKALEELGVLVPEGVDEDRLLDLYYNQIRFRNSSFNVALLTTASCNFGCSYCYEGDLTYGKKHMSDETADHAVSWLQARAKENRASSVNVLFHGGEPLLNIPVIEKVGREMSGFCQENGMKFVANMFSNGYLLDRETAERVKAVGVTAAKVTIDGPEDVHNSLRFLKGRGKTYRTIIKNLLEIKDILTIDLGINYNKDTAHRIPEFLDNLIKIGLGPGVIRKVECQPIMPGGGSGKASALDSGCIPTAGLFGDLLSVQEEVVKRGFGNYAEPEISPCAVVQATYFIINHDGALFKCPALVDQPKYAVGHVAEDFGYNAEMYRCLGYNTFENETCRNCSVLPICLGGCRYLALVEKGEFHSIECRRKEIETIALDAVRRMAKEANT